MNLTGKQKKFIKKNWRKYSVDKIATTLKLPEKAIVNYLVQTKKTTNILNPSNEKKIDYSFTHFFKKYGLQILLLLLLTSAVYANSLFGEFLSDDIAGIKDNPLIKQPSFFNFPFTNLRLLMIAVTYRIFGHVPALYHLQNLMFHLGSIIMVFFLLALFFGNMIGFFSAALFAIHPLQSEAVTWISGGAYGIGVFFMLLAFVFYLKAENKKINLFISAFIYLVAICTSTQAITLFPIIFLFELARGKIKKSLLKLLPFFLITFVFGWLFFFQAKTRSSTLQTTYYSAEAGQHDNILTKIPVALSSYLWLAIWPKNLTLYHTELFFTKTNIAFRIATTLLYLLSGIFFYLKKEKRLFFLVYLFPLSLALSLTPLRIAWTVAERYVYLGAVSIYLIFAFTMEKLIKNKKIYYIIASIFILILSIRTVFRNNDWKNQDNLWLSAAKTSPTSPQNHNNLGDLYARRQQWDKAIEEFTIAINLKPNYGDAYHNRGNIYAQTGKVDLAIKDYQKAVSLNPNLWQSHQNLGSLYFNQKKYLLAEEEFRKVIQIDPQNYNARGGLGVILSAQGKHQEAREEIKETQQTIEKILKENPNDQNAKNALQGLKKLSP